MTFTDTSQQEDIYNFVVNGEGHGLVIARAGSGKTSSIQRAIQHIPEDKSCLYLVFSKSNALEAEKRFAKSPNVRSGTSHSFGFSCIRETFDKVLLSKNKALDAAAVVAKSRTERYALVKAASLAKGNLSMDPEEIEVLCNAHGIDVGRSETKFVDRVLELLKLCNLFDLEADEQVVDFDDQVWWPAVNSDLIFIPQYDFVLPDEVQDLTPAQLQLAMLALKPDGRMLAVGDDRQMIFGFRGAHRSALEHLKERLKPTILPLTTTFRCPVSVVKEAQRFVPDIQALPDAPQGEVRSLSLLKAVEEVEYGDFVLSRTNAPLVQFALKLIKTKCAVCILGREIGDALVTLLYKLNAERVDQIAPLAELWLERKTKKLLEKDPPAEEAAKLAEDQVACLVQLAREATSVGMVADAIRKLFVAEGNPDCVTLSTVHKAKGLERARVYLLRNTFLRPRKGFVSEEEKNIMYVGITRAKRELVYVI